MKSEAQESIRSQLETISNLERKVAIAVPKEHVQEAFHRAYTDLQKSVTIKGFRKGKAPLATIRGLYSDRVREEVVRDLVSSGVRAAINEHGLKPTEFPQIHIDRFEQDEELSFQATFEVFPEIPSILYEGLSAQTPALPDLEKLVDEALERIRQNQTVHEPLNENRPAKLGDFVKLSYVGVVDGGALEDLKADNFIAELNQEKFIEGFVDGLLGAAPQEVRTLNLRFPADYHEKTLADRPVVFTITVHELMQAKLPELDDAFAKAVGGGESLQDLRSALQDQIRREQEKETNAILRSTLLASLVAKNPFDVPNSLLERQKKTLLKESVRQLRSKNFNDEQIAEILKSDERDPELERTAEAMVREAMLISRLAEQLGLECTDELFDEQLRTYSKSTGIDFEILSWHYAEKRDLRDRLEYKITEDRVVAKLLETAKLTEKP